MPDVPGGTPTGSIDREAAPDLPISTHGYVPPPLSLRTDALGIFSVLTVSGLSQLREQPGSLLSLVPNWVALTWVTSLVVFGALGVVATILGRRARIVGMALEAVARVVLGATALVYGIAVLVARGVEPGGRFVVLTYLGMAVLLWVGAWQIVRWLRAQRRAVDRAMEGHP